MDLNFCFIDITKLNTIDCSNLKDYILFVKCQDENNFENGLSDIILTIFYVYQDTIRVQNKSKKCFQFQIDKNKSKIIVLAIIENWNYAFLVSVVESSLISKIYFKSFVENLDNLLKFLFGTLENSFLKHKQETSIIIDKSVQNFSLLSLQKPFENYRNYSIELDDLLMDFAASYNRNEKEYILISDVYLMRENFVLYSRHPDYVLELFLYHSIIRCDNEGVLPKFYFHKVHSLESSSEQQRYSFLVSNCFYTFMVLFNCQLKDIKSPPVSLMKQSRAFVKKLNKYIKDNIPDVKLFNYQNIEEIISQSGRKENKLVNWFRSRSVSFSMNDKITEDSKGQIKVFGDSLFSSSSIYGLKYRNSLLNCRYDFPFKFCTWEKIDELNNLLTNLDEEMKYMANDLQLKSFEIVHLVDLNDETNQKKLFVKIVGIYDEIKGDWLLVCVKQDCPVDAETCLNNIRQFIQC